MHCRFFAMAFLCLFVRPAAGQEKPFAIEVVDDQTGRGVPLVELRTVHGVCYLTDSRGLVAFHEPGLMNTEVFFFVTSHGYEFPKDGFGYRGQRFIMTPGGQATLKIRRINIAQRLYRVIGAGIYRDSVLLGRDAPIREPLLNAGVLGSDSVLNAIYRGKLHWFWGDTNLARYPLGIFDAPGATSELPSSGGLDPRLGVDLTYFLGDKGVAKGTAPMKGDGPTWLGGLATLPDAQGKIRLVSSFVKIRAPMEAYRRGLAEFDDAAERFREVAEAPLKAPIFPEGHPLAHREGNVDYLYFASPYPLVRVKATRQSWADLSQYEAFSCLQPGSRLADGLVDRDQQGHVRYGWKQNTPPVTVDAQKKFVAEKKLREDECLIQLRDRDTGKAINAGLGSVYYNAFRRRWILIMTQVYGTSLLGETWYSEADTPLGPWVYAVKIVTHDNYSFYNPKQHPYFDADQGRTIFFEGTYTHTFSGTKTPTPRYDYNQIMYSLDLGDRRLALPLPVYRTPGSQGDALAMRTGGEWSPAGRAIAFFALERPVDKCLPIYQTRDAQGRQRLQVGGRTSGEPLFYALPADFPDPPSTTRLLQEYEGPDGRTSVSVSGAAPPAGWKRRGPPLCRVWHNPYAGQP